MERRLVALQALTDVTLNALSLQDLLDTLVERLRVVLRADSAAILLLDPDDVLRIRAVSGLEETVAPKVRVPLGQGFAGRVALRSTPWIIDDLRSTEVVNPYLHELVRSAIGVPLRLGDTLYGVLHIDSAARRHFTADDAHLLRLVADRAAKAIERARLEDALRERERRFRAIFEQAAVGIARVAPDGRILEANDRLCEILDYTRDELLTKTFQQITYPEDLPANLRLVAGVLSGEATRIQIEKRYVRPDRSVVWADLTAALVRRPNGEPEYFITVIEDITARKEAEQALQHLTESLEERVATRTSALESAYRELEEITYSISHDLRAPLRGMQGFAHALVEDYGPRMPEEAQHYAVRIADGALRMDALIEDLLAYGRLGRRDARARVLSLGAAVRAAVAGLETEVKARHAEVLLREPFPRVWAHSLTLEMVLTNLLSNALKFVAPESNPRITVWAERLGDNVRLWIEDQGIGIAPEDQERIFRMFERLHGPETYPGTGMGLAIVRRGMERLGGRVGVESRSGAGARFWIELRAGDARPPTDMDPES